MRPGDPTTDFIVLLEGLVAIVDNYKRPNERQIIEHGPRSLLGEYNAISGQPALFTCVARSEGHALLVPVHEMRILIEGQSALSSAARRSCVRQPAES